jgi:hypothetical protein
MFVPKKLHFSVKAFRFKTLSFKIALCCFQADGLCQRPLRQPRHRRRPLQRTAEHPSAVGSAPAGPLPGVAGRLAGSARGGGAERFGQNLSEFLAGM